MEQLPQPQETETNLALSGLQFVIERLRGGAWGQLAEQVKE